MKISEIPVFLFTKPRKFIRLIELSSQYQKHHAYEYHYKEEVHMKKIKNSLLSV
jgi:hypothetical protein